VRYNQQTAARQLETLPESGEGTRPEEAGGDCCRTKPHPSKPEQASTSGSGKQSAKAAECLIVSSVSPPTPSSKSLIPDDQASGKPNLGLATRQVNETYAVNVN